MECPRKFKLEYDRVEPPKKDNRYYAVRGSVIQKFFELYSNGHYPTGLELNSAGVSKFMKPYYERELEYNWVDWKSPMSKLSRSELFEEIVEIAVENLKRLDVYREGMRSEVKIVVSLKSGDEIVGKIDFIKKYPDGTKAILDGKATKTIGKNIDLDQLLLYSWLEKMSTGVAPDKLGFLYYSMQEIDWKRFDGTDMESAVRKILYSLECAKRAVSFPPTPSASACNYCPYVSECQEGLKDKASRKRGSRTAKTDSEVMRIGNEENGFIGLAI
jgi:RecB family exonuclease